MTTTPPRGCDASGRARYAAIWSPPSPAMVTEPAVMASELSAWGMSHGPFELRGRHGMRTVVPPRRRPPRLGCGAGWPDTPAAITTVDSDALDVGLVAGAGRPRSGCTAARPPGPDGSGAEIGRASCRERV